MLTFYLDNRLPRGAPMIARPVAPTRILVVARPARSRAVAEALAGTGYSVNRTPSAEDLTALVARLGPELIVIALDLPWSDTRAAVCQLRERTRPVPVLLLTDDEPAAGLSDLPRLPLAADAALLRSTVVDLLLSPGRPRG
jgi:CheY-like chemotaxis protein